MFKFLNTNSLRRYQLKNSFDFSEVLTCFVLFFFVLGCSEENVVYDRFSEAAAAIGFRTSSAQIQEGTQSTVIEVGVSKRIFEEISFQLSIDANSNQIFITDESGSEINTINLGPNKDTENIIITSVDDTQYTGNRDIDIGLNNLKGRGAFFAKQTVSAKGLRLNPLLTVTIVDDETPPISINMQDSTGGILENASVSHTVDILLGSPATRPSSFEIILSGTAKPSEDYDSAAIDGVINVDVKEGESNLQVNIDPIDNDIIDGDRSVVLTLSNPGEGLIIGSDNVHTLTIMDDDDQTPPISINMKDSTGGILENASVSHTVDILLGSPATRPSSFEIILSGTAKPSEDYDSAAIDGVINVDVKEGESNLQVNIDPIDNDIIDGDRSVVLTLSNPGEGLIIGSDNVHTLTIMDDDGGGDDGGDDETPNTTPRVQLNVDQDAWFRGKPGSKRADENHGAANTLVASQGDRDDDNRQFYLRFDLSNIDVTKVNSAVIELTAVKNWTDAETANQGRPTTQSVYLVADDWKELAITANNQPEILSDQPVLTFTADALVGEVDLSASPIHQYDVTSVVKQENDKILSLLFTTVFTNGRRITYSSKEAIEEKQPRLILEIKQ